MNTTNTKNIENQSTVLPRNWDLPQTFHDRLGKRAGAQRAMFHDGHLLLITHEVPESGKPERQGIFFWRAPDGAWRSSVGAGFFRLSQLVDRYAKRVDEIEETFGHADDAATLFQVLRDGSPLRRSAANLKRTLQQAREAVGGRELIAERDRADEVMLASELVIVDAKNALDYTMARQAEEQSRLDREQAINGERLNRLAAYFLPLTLLASLFGMNLPSGLENISPAIFWAIIGTGLLIGLIVSRFQGPTGGANIETSERTIAAPRRRRPALNA